MAISLPDMQWAFELESQSCNTIVCSDFGDPARGGLLVPLAVTVLVYAI